MTQPVLEHGVPGSGEAAPTLRPTISGVTWRYLGERAAADSAYCTRFNVAQAPEPLVAPDGAWAYTLPVPKPPR